jgi:hypothetical protein
MLILMSMAIACVMVYDLAYDFESGCQYTPSEKHMHWYADDVSKLYIRF